MVGKGGGMLMVAVRVSVDVRDGSDSGERGAGLYSPVSLSVK